MRVALLCPLSRSPIYDPDVQEPLGIESLAAFLHTKGHTVFLQDAMTSSQSEEEIARCVTEFGAQVVGLSLMSDADIESALFFIRRIRGLSRQEPRFVVGGSFVSTEPERVDSLLPEETILIRFEGELPLLRLLDAIAKGESIDRVPSMLRREDGRFVEPFRYESVADLDRLPWPSRDLAPAMVRRNGVLNIQGSRGCAGRCSYCCMPSALEKTGTSWRGRSPQNIADELARLKRENGVCSFNFVDDDLLGPIPQAQRRALNLAYEIRERNLRIGFGAQLRPGTLTEKATDALAEAGLAWAFIGIENDDPDTLRTWHRSRVTGDAWQAISRLRDRGVEVSAGAILFHPTATLDGVRRFSRVLREHGLLNYRTATSRLHLLPGSRLYELATRAGDGNADSVGPFAPPLTDSNVAALFEHFVRVSSPVRPCWVHAACLLPGLTSQCKAGCSVLPTLQGVRQVLHEIDEWVCEILDQLIVEIDGGGVEPDWLASVRATSYQKARSACRQLLRTRTVADPTQLRSAIDLEGAP